MERTLWFDVPVGERVHRGGWEEGKLSAPVSAPVEGDNLRLPNSSLRLPDSVDTQFPALSGGVGYFQIIALCASGVSSYTGRSRWWFQGLAAAWW